MQIYDYLLNILFNNYSLSVFTSLFVVLVSIYVKRSYKLKGKSEPKTNKNILEVVEEEEENSDVEDGKEDEEVYKKYFQDENFFDLDQTKFENCESVTTLINELKAAKFKAVEETLSEDQKVAEREIERQQLANIYDLLRKQEEEYNLGQMKEEDFQAQLSLYR